MARWKMWILGAALALAVGTAAIGSENDPFEQFAVTVRAIKEPIQLAMIAISPSWGLPDIWPNDALAALQLLEGEGFADELRGGTQGSIWFSQPWPDAPVRSLVDGLELTNVEWDSVAEGINQHSTSRVEGRDLRASWQFLRNVLRVASDALQEAVVGGSESERLRDELTIAFALLDSAYDYAREISEILCLEISVEPGESIQAAIDQAIPGTRISIIAGTYRETLEITKSITLTGGGWLDYVDAEQSYDSSVEPVASQAAILVHSVEPIDVTIEGLAIRHTELGISVRGEARLALDHVNIREAVTGIHVADQAKLTLENCWFDENGVVLVAEGQSDAQLDGCRIDDSTDPVASIVIRESAHVAMDQTWIQRGEGSGILMAGTGSLTLGNGFLSGNRGDGIVLAEQASLHLTDTFFYGNGGLALRALSDACPSSETLPYGAFTGTITGFGNSIGERASALHEEQVTCPEELEALLEAFAEDEIDSDGD